MKIEGGCYCGEVRYSFEGEPGPAMQCHCRECQYITGGNPNVFVMIPESGLHFTQGELNSFQRAPILKTPSPDTSARAAARPSGQPRPAHPAFL